MPQIPRRAHSIAELQERLSLFFTEEGYASGLAFTPKASDVLIATYPKCGTTWMQQIIHGLRTRGDMAFSEITAAVPWLEAAHDMGIDPQAPQRADPRAYKTHLTWHDIPKGGRYVHVIRNPDDALVSAYRFMEGWFFEPGAIDLDTYANERFLVDGRRDDYWRFLLSWWPRRHEADVLFVFFEDMKHDLGRTIVEVAGFIGCPLDDELKDIVMRQSSIGFMKAHQHQFNDHLLRTARDAACGLPLDGAATKVDGGRVGDSAQILSKAITDALDARWRETVGRELGIESYAALRAHWHEECESSGPG